MTVERSMARVLSSDVITDSQRATAWEKFYQADWAQKMLWSSKVGAYVREVVSGKRAPRPEVVATVAQPVAEVVSEPVAEVVSEPVAEEVQQLEIAAHAVQQQVEQQAQIAEEIMEEVGEVVAAAIESRQQGQPVPMWVGTTNREELPAGLQWSGQRLPAVAETVKVVRRGRTRQVKVVGYFHAEGFLGIQVEYEGKVPSVLRTSPRSQCFFGTEVRGLLAFVNHPDD